MAKYINRELLVGDLNADIAACENPLLESESVSYGCKIGLTYAVGLVKAMPDADVVEVRHGEWIGHEGYEECNICHHKALFEHNYCPNCGAKMDGGGDGNDRP